MAIPTGSNTEHWLEESFYFWSLDSFLDQISCNMSCYDELGLHFDSIHNIISCVFAARAVTGFISRVY